jgi:hypothetical protein
MWGFPDDAVYRRGFRSSGYNEGTERASARAASCGQHGTGQQYSIGQYGGDGVCLYIQSYECCGMLKSFHPSVRPSSFDFFFKRGVQREVC